MPPTDGWTNAPQSDNYQHISASNNHQQLVYFYTKMQKYLQNSHKFAVKSLFRKKKKNLY